MKTIFKTSLKILCTFTLCLPSIQLTAETDSGSEADRPQSEGQRERGEGVTSIERFLHLSDDQLDRLIAGIERIRAMTPEERRELAEEMSSFRALPPQQRERLHQRMGNINREDHEEIREMVESMRPRERRRMLRNMRDMDPDERMDYRLERLEQWGQRQSR